MAVLRVAAGAMLVASVAINFANIIGRYFFSVSLSWAEEAMLFLMIGCVFLGAARSAGSAATSAWTSSSRCCRRAARAGFEMFSDLVTIATCVMLAVFAWPVMTMLAELDQRSDIGQHPAGHSASRWCRSGLLLMALLIAVRLIVPACATTT